jgi:RPA family protein
MQRPEVKEKMSIGIKASMTEERLKKMSEQSKNLWATEEYRERMKRTQKHNSGADHYRFGKHCSEETKRKISETKRKKKLALIAASFQFQSSPSLLVQ